MTTRAPGQSMSTWRFCRAYFRVTFAIMLEYRATVFIWLLAGVTPLIMMFVWRNLAADGPIGGRDPKAFAAYFLLAFLVIQSCQAWSVWNVDYYVRSGTYAIQLLRPYDPWFSELIENVTAKALRSPINLLIVAAGLVLTGAWELIEVGNLPVFLLALALSWQLMFNLNYALALLGFWTERIKSVDAWIYTMLYTLGGAVFPVDLLPPTLRSVVELTPFPWMVDFPVALLTGSAAPLKGLAIQAGWIAITVLCHRILWARGLKRFGAVGG
jgi:ABC-2 type transport system permease protein